MDKDVEKLETSGIAAKNSFRITQLQQEIAQELHRLLPYHSTNRTIYPRNWNTPIETHAYKSLIIKE